MSVATVRQATISELLRRTAARVPDKTALVWGPERTSYADLDATVDRTAHALAERGVTKGDRIALLAHNSGEFVVFYLAMARLGAISVPVNFMLGPDEVAYVLGHSGATGLVVEDALAPVGVKAVEIAGAELRVRGWIGAEPPYDGFEPVRTWMAHPDTTPVVVEIADDDPLQLLYTSGTESRPKGAMLTSRSLIAQYVSCLVDGEMTRDDVEVHSLPLFHCAQLHCFLTPDLYVGATSIVLPGPDPARLLETIERERVTKLFCPPTVWISLLRHPDFETRDLSSLRKGYYGAAIMPTEVLQELARRLPSVRLFNFYGQTEMAPLATVLPPEDQLRKLGSCGRASLNCETRLVDDDGTPVPVGEIGEIVHRSPHAMLGYWEDPAKTEEAFRDGWFHSGDLGVMDAEGYLTVVDRKKDMIKTGGENVASREVEEVVYRHPGVSEVAVFGVAHPYWIEAVTAVVVRRADAEVTADDVLAVCREHLAGFKVPKYVVFADSLPKNPSGKILKRQLRGAYASVVEA